MELDRYLAEGLVPVQSLGEERFIYEEDGFRLVGKSSGRSYRLGDRVEVRVRRVSAAERKADFLLV